MRAHAQAFRLPFGQAAVPSLSLAGPRLGNSPVPSIVQCLARKDGTDDFYQLKVSPSRSELLVLIAYHVILKIIIIIFKSSKPVKTKAIMSHWNFEPLTFFSVHFIAPLSSRAQTTEH